MHIAKASQSGSTNRRTAPGFWVQVLVYAGLGEKDKPIEGLRTMAAIKDPRSGICRAAIAVADAPVLVAVAADSRRRITASPPASRANRAANPTTLNIGIIEADF